MKPLHLIDSMDRDFVYCECGHQSPNLAAHLAHQRTETEEISRAGDQKGLYVIHCSRYFAGDLALDSSSHGKIPRRPGRE